MTNVLETVKSIVNDVKQLLPFTKQTNLSEAQKKLNNYLESQRFLSFIQSIRDEGVHVKCVSKCEDIIDDERHNTVFVSTSPNSPDLLDYFFIAYADMGKFIILDELVAISCFVKENPDYAEFIENRRKISVEYNDIRAFISQSSERLSHQKLDIKQLTDLVISFNQKWGKYLPINFNMWIEQNVARVELGYREIEIGENYFLKMGKENRGFSVNIDNATVPNVLSIHVSPKGELIMKMNSNSATHTFLNNKEHKKTLALPPAENPEPPEAIEVRPKERPSQCGFFSVSIVHAATAAVVLATVVGTLDAGMSYFRNDI